VEVVRRFALWMLALFTLLGPFLMSEAGVKLFFDMTNVFYVDAAL
jgi:hypothetical protein